MASVAILDISYLLDVDYSHYPEVAKLSLITSASVVSALKNIFSRHGIPEVKISDNGPRYDERICFILWHSTVLKQPLLSFHKAL